MRRLDDSRRLEQLDKNLVISSVVLSFSLCPELIPPLLRRLLLKLFVNLSNAPTSRPAGVRTGRL